MGYDPTPADGSVVTAEDDRTLHTLRTAAQVAAAASMGGSATYGSPRTLKLATQNSRLSLRRVMLSKSYDEYMLGEPEREPARLPSPLPLPLPSTTTTIATTIAAAPRAPQACRT